MLGQFHPDSENGSQIKVIHPKGKPILRIGLLENRDSIEFRLSGRFSVFNDQGISILKDVASSVKWRLKIQKRLAAKYAYSILLGKFHNLQAAHDLEYRLIEKGIGTRINIRGGKLFYNERRVSFGDFNFHAGNYAVPSGNGSRNAVPDSRHQWQDKRAPAILIEGETCHQAVPDMGIPWTFRSVLAGFTRRPVVFCA